jgi:hypothetical protein
MVDRKEFEGLTVNVFAPIINNYIFKFNLPSMNHDDLRQEALTALWRSMDKYDPAKGPIHSYAKGVVFRHINMVVGTALAKCRWAGPPLPLHILEVGGSPPDEQLVLDMSLPNFDRSSIAKRNWAKSAKLLPRNTQLCLENRDCEMGFSRYTDEGEYRLDDEYWRYWEKPTRKTQKRIVMGNRLHISDQSHDLEFIREIVAEHALEPEPMDEYWTAKDYWYEDGKYKRVVERYPWGCVLFLANKEEDDYATVVYEELEPQPYEEALVESKAISWYPTLIEHFKKSTPEQPHCFGHYVVDPVCDGGYNTRVKLMEASCVWNGECREASDVPERKTLEQLAQSLCETISEISGLPLGKEGERDCLFIQTLDRKNEEGLYLKYTRKNGAKAGVLVLKHKRRNLAVGLATEASAHKLLEPVNWGRYKSAIKKLRSESQFSAIIQVACQIVDQLKG